ncbi:bifunctional 2-polyprenyl-6-hydroxyphenol methylase/3-demethylubiquinol 3-O-methyltransferase UbiG [Streptomyces sp. Rer75]|uniref:class I SAM-dependent methyltransferase n=1 Tax=unclassified Streptomyces TaxID=2593676 RepID=UPI0015D07523|nr:class I SAM-dependent methyltransferase [Streptomyces sp. Rer75]QLH25622.1 methyltransferase domain-containing protein [Streptomyces sp. Rer75]
MTAPTEHTRLPEALEGRPALSRIAERVLARWPEHGDFLAVRFGGCEEEHLDFCESVARSVLAIAGDELDRCADSYRWTCERMLEEDYHFQLTGEYRYRTFQEVLDGIGLDAAYMTRYTDGLLLSQLFWVNQTRALHCYVTDFLSAVREGDTLLEVGPGHGLLLALAAGRAGARVTGWDVSEGSIACTREALARLGHTARLHRQDLRTAPATERFDHVVASELLEHVDEPEAALRRLRDLVRPGGRLFVNIPVNSPAPDHINLWRTPEEVAAYVRDAGLEVLAEAVFPMTGCTEDEARANASTLSCVLICRP